MNKKYLFSILITLMSFFAHFPVKAQQLNYDPTPYAMDYHQKRLALFQTEPIVEGKAIFLGDSITEFGDWQKLLNDSTIINRGIAGDNTFGVLNRLDDVIVRHPSKLFIEVGINDISKNIPNDVIVKNILTIVKNVKAKSPQTKVFVHSVLPTNDAVKNEYPQAFNKNYQVVKVNKQLKSKAKKGAFTYIDLYSKVIDKNGQLEIKYAESDGLHLNQNGYRIWAELLEEYFNNLWRSSAFEDGKNRAAFR